MNCSRNDTPAKYLRKVALSAVNKGETEEQFVSQFVERLKEAARAAFRSATTTGVRRTLVALLFTLLALTTGTARAQNQGDDPIKYSNYVLTPALFDRMPASLKAVKNDFAIRLSTVGAIIETEDGYFLGSGCATHMCGADGAAWVINKATGKGAAIIMRYYPPYRDNPAFEHFELYMGNLDTIPAPLMDWAVQNGMTEGNRILESEPLPLNLGLK